MTGPRILFKGEYIHSPAFMLRPDTTGAGPRFTALYDGCLTVFKENSEAQRGAGLKCRHWSANGASTLEELNPCWVHAHH